MLVLGIALAFFMSPELSVVFFICTPVLGAVLFLVVRHIAPHVHPPAAGHGPPEQRRAGCLTAIRAVKAFVRGEYEEESLRRSTHELMQVSRSTFRTAVLNLPAFQLTMYAACVLILWLGGTMILNGALTVGRLTSFLSYVMQVMNSLMMISNVFLLIDPLARFGPPRRPGAGRARGAHLAENAVTEIPDGGIRFENVSSNITPTRPSMRWPTST